MFQSKMASFSEENRGNISTWQRVERLGRPEYNPAQEFRSSIVDRRRWEARGLQPHGRSGVGHHCLTWHEVWRILLPFPIVISSSILDLDFFCLLSIKVRSPNLLWVGKDLTVTGRFLH